MIINLWSTPRTGSVWYSYHLQKKLCPSTLLTEPFNKYHMDLYYRIENGIMKNYHEYLPGSFYKNYSWANGKLMTERKFQQRTRTIEEEEKYLVSLLEKIDGETNYVIHNHVSPMSENIRTKLMTMGENIFIYRKDKVAQLASYAIACETKEFVRFSRKENIQEKITIRDIEPLRNLINRIKVWDSLTKENSIAYEDIGFYELDGMPIKQNADYLTRLSIESINQIIELLKSEYY